ncbi:MAG: transcription termination factor Rho, partial [Bacteroidaceae bacterium]|nr:transcription termination factor Rho [Bacteroidaceae bacterium]
MPKYKLEELLSKSIEEVRSIAQALGLKIKQSDSQQTIAYDIIDEQAIIGSQSVSEPRKKRPRINESAKTEEGSAKRSKAKKTTKTEEAKAENKEAEPAVEAKPKRRGRPRKDEAVASENAKADADAPTAEPEAKATEVKRKGRPRKSDKTAEAASAAAENENKQTAIATSLFDEEASSNYSNSTDAPMASPQPETKENDFIILQDIPSAELVDSQLGDYEQGINGKQADKDSAKDAEPKADKDNSGEESKNDFAMSRRPSQTYDFGEAIIGSGVLEITPEGQGYLRSADYNYLTSPDDIFITPQIIKQYGLKMGDVVEGPVRAPKESEKFFTLIKVTHINGLDPDKVRDRQTFEHLTPLFPDEKFQLCKGDGSDSLSARVVDLFAPIGKGQRALLVAQPKTGKTMILKSIANAIAANHPEAYLMMLLIDERPEEVTDMARTVNAEVIASTFDEPASNHVKIAGIVLEKAKRMV